MITLVGADEPHGGPTLDELAKVAQMAAEAARLCRVVTESLARWGMEVLDDDG